MFHTGHRIGGAACLLLTLLTACTSRLPLSSNLPAAGPLDTRVDYVTTRATRTDNQGRTFYTGKPGETGFGTCLVSLQGDKETLVAASSRTRESLETDLDANAPVVIYIHGYNEGFERSCRRAGKLKHQLDVPNLVLFSWPANRNPLTYEADIRDVTWNRPLLTGYLDALLADTQRDVILLGHSMGARALFDALAELDPAAGARLSKVIFIAPDIDRARFGAGIENLVSRVPRLLVYVSEKDFVLQVSNFINGGRRLGQGQVLEYPGLTIIDVAAVHRVGHEYHLHNEAAIEDLRIELGTQNERQLTRREEIADGFLRLYLREDESGDGATR